MKTYEGMFILPETIKDEALDETVGRLRAEIEKFGGSIENTTRLGRRNFARKLDKKQGGHYVVITFQLDETQIVPLQERYKLSEDVFRLQIVRAVPVPPAPAKKETENVVVQ